MTDVFGGLRVLDLSKEAPGAIAAMFFADFGAEVVLVDSGGRDDPGFAMWDRGKRRTSVAPSDFDFDFDIAITDGHEPPAEAGERLVRLHLPPFADHVPWGADVPREAMIQSTTGIALRQASFAGGPIDGIVPVVSTIQGIWGAAAATAALIERQRSGRGQLVTVAGIHAALVASGAAFNFDESAAVPARGAGGPGGGVPFYRLYECGDGEWLFLAALTPRFTTIAFEVLGITDILDDPRLEGRGRAGILLPANSAWAIERIASVFATEPRVVWLERLAKAGCPAGAVLDRDAWLDHPQIDAIGMRVEADDPVRGRVVMPGVPFRIEPRGGEAVATAPPAGAMTVDGNGPLDGMRVLDLGAIIAGPFAASLLADLGADVVKVEPLGGDSFRGPGFAAYNKGQRSIAVDLQHPDGRAVLLDLARDADVVIDNYRPGVLGRLGLEWRDLAEVNPTIISASITGFGAGGPLGNEAGFDPVLQAMSGMMSAQGGDDEPVFYTVPVNDVTTAAATALAVLVAVFHRDRTGQGQRVTASLAAVATVLQASDIVRFDGRPRPRRGSRDHRGPEDTDRYVESDDGWVRVHGEAAAPARTARELVHDERLLAYDAFRRDPRPGRATFWTTGRHAHFNRTQRTDDLLAPALGEHTREVLLAAGYPEPRIAELLAAGVLS